MTPDVEWYCGCCGGDLDQSGVEWCGRCRPHVSTDHRLPPWERTYFARHRTDCPYQVGGPDTGREATGGTA